MSKRFQGELTLCNSCGEALIYLKHPATGKLAPITVATYPKGNILELPGFEYQVLGPHKAEEVRARGQHLKLSHFANCPNVKGFKR